MSNWSIVFILFLVVYLGVGLFFYFYQESFLFHPRKTTADFVYEFNYPYTENFYQTPQKGLIHTLTFNAKESRGVVFYLHGNAGSLRDWGWIYADFVPRGYDLVLLDYRTYGKSTGKLSESNIISDAAFVFDEIAKNYKSEDIVIYGRSIGSGVAVQLAMQKNAKALVLESPYYSIADVARKIAPVFPLNLLLRYKFESYQYLPQVKCPKYIIHGKADQVVPFSSGQKLAKLDPEGVKFYSVEDGQHNDLANFSAYDEMLGEVLD